MRAQKRPTRGFTLLELGVVLAVAAILGAAVLPDVIESARGRMAEKAANGVTMIQDAAKWFFVESSPAADPGSARWPGERDAADGAAPNTCAERGSASKKAKNDLQDNGYLPASAFANPFGGVYDLSLVPGTPSAVCALKICANFPNAQVANAFKSLLPVATCPSSTRCCSQIPKPGAEASIQFAIDDLKNRWIPQNVYSELDAAAGLSCSDSTQACSACPFGFPSGVSCRADNVTFTAPVVSHPGGITKYSIGQTVSCQLVFLGSTCGGAVVDPATVAGIPASGPMQGALRNCSSRPLLWCP